MFAQTNTSQHVVAASGGIELQSANANYYPSSPVNAEKSSKMKFWAITALVLAILAFILAGVIAATVIPNLGDTADTNAAASTGDDSEEDTTTWVVTTTEEPTSEPTNKPTTEPTTWKPTVEGETRPPSRSPTKSPTKSPTDADAPIVVINETNKYYTDEVTQYYECNVSCPSSTFGIINVNQTHIAGGYVGWDFTTSYPDLYPFKDIHANIGDDIHFIAGRQSWTGEDVWIVPEQTYIDCDFTVGFGGQQLSVGNEIRQDGPYYNDSEGYRFLIENWHVRDWGDTLYFASAYNWMNTTAEVGSWELSHCLQGVKVKVIIEDRVSLPVVTDDASSFDLLSTDIVQELIASIGYLSRTLILQQFSDEQRIRSEGDSGLTNVRGHWDGSHQYDDGTYSNYASASIHDHPDDWNLVGIGEIQAVLNGVEFQTRHNDYDLDMPSLTSTDYHATENIPRPDVPPEVLNAPTINDQIIEMKEWFRAFKYQNISHRNYTKYFKPILCYLEGTWLLDEDNLNEPFNSNRHSFDAATWKQLHDKIRWMTNSGRKNSLENLAHLPSSIRNLVNDTYPIISNWEYRILCHPLKNNVPTSRFRISDDLSVQLMGSPQTRNELYYSRRARFEINKWFDEDNYPDSLWSDDYDVEWNDGQMRWNYLDYLMEQIPGKDNYLANLTDILPDGTFRTVHYMDNSVINAGYYSRFYSLLENDAMGTTQHRRGWSDRYLFAASTSHKAVSPINLNYEIDNNDGTYTYYPTESRWSYAIPLEIIYMTPLTNWNPYNIQYYSSDIFDYTRSGECGISPYIGYTSNRYYYTPSSFFISYGGGSDADTASSSICVLDNNNIERSVYASGHWITFPEIENIGYIRQRYPIFPIHDGGHTAFKEVKALETILLKNDYDNVETGIDFWTDNRDLYYGFNLYLEGGGHNHLLSINSWEIQYKWYDYNNNKYYNGSNYIIKEDTTISNGHQHTIELYRYKTSEQDSVWNYVLIKCRFGDESPDDEATYSYQNNYCADFHDTLKRDTGSL